MDRQIVTLKKIAIGWDTIVEIPMNHLEGIN